MTQQFYQNQTDRINQGIADTTERAINPQLSLQQLQQLMDSAGYVQNPEMYAPKRSWMPTIIGAGLGTAIGALAGYRGSDAALGGLAGGLMGYGSENKRRNEYIEKAQNKNHEIMKQFLINAVDQSKTASTFNTLSNANKTQAQTQSGMNFGKALTDTYNTGAIKPPPMAYPQEPISTPELENAKTIINSYGGAKKAMQAIQEMQMTDDEKNYIQSNLDIINNPPRPLTGGIEADNRPLFMSKPSDMEKAFMRPYKIEGEKALTGTRKSATAKNMASVKNINKRTAEIGKTGGSKENIKQNEKNSVANARSEWDNAMQGYMKKHGKRPSQDAQQGMKNALKSKHGNTIYYQAEKYFK